MALSEIRELLIDVRLSAMEADGPDKEQLAHKLEQASFADLVVVVEERGF